jgi:hypothetical protein
MNRFLTTAGMLLFCAGLGWGTDFAWTGAGSDHRWDNPANWSSSPPAPGFPGYDSDAGLPRDDTVAFVSSAALVLSGLIAPGDLGGVTIQLEDDSVTLALEGPASGATEFNLRALRITGGSQLNLTVEGTVSFSDTFSALFNAGSGSVALESAGDVALEGSGAGISGDGQLRIAAAGTVRINGPIAINGAFDCKGALIAIGNNDSGGAQTGVTASTALLDASLVKGNITFDAEVGFLQSSMEFAGHIMNKKTIRAGAGQSLYFSGNYTGESGGLLAGTDGGSAIHFRKNAEFSGSPPSAYEDRGSLLVFSGPETQEFDSGGNTLGNVTINKEGGELRLLGSGVVQREGSKLTIAGGLLNLAHWQTNGLAHWQANGLDHGGGIDADEGMGWTMGLSDSAGPARASNFLGLDGTLVFNNDSGTAAELRAVDMTLGENCALTVKGGGDKLMAAMGNIDIAKGAGNKDFGASSVAMIPGSGAGRTAIGSDAALFRLIVLRPAKIIRDLTVTEMQLGSPACVSGISLDGGSSTIRVLGGWTNHSVDTDGDGITRAFIYGTSEVIFEGTANPDNHIAIRGGSAWHTFTCASPGAILQFDNYPSRHYVARSFTAKGTPEGHITLTRLNDQGQPDRKPPDAAQPPLPLTEAERRKYWDFVVRPGAEGRDGAVLDLANTIVSYSNANLRLPIPPKVFAYPFYSDDNPAPPSSYPGAAYERYSYYNINWIVEYGFIYAFTEDSDGNGRIDRVRAQAAFELNAGEAGAFDRIRVRITKPGERALGERALDEWIRVKGYGMVPGSPDSIYIYLEEHDYADGGARGLAVEIAANESLTDLATGLSPLRNSENGPLLTIDTVFPRISYALMLPGSDRAFVQFSEDVDYGSAEFVYPGNRSPGTVYPVSPGRTHEFELAFAGTGYAVSDLAAGPLFTIRGIGDHGVAARDKNEDNPGFPPPKYPVNWKYDEYVFVPGNPPDLSRSYSKVPGDRSGSAAVYETPLIPPNVLPGEILSHRVTDALVSDYPGEYFALPVWAMNTQDQVGPGQGAHVVRVFNGGDSLEDRDITLEVNINPDLASYTPEFIFGSAIPDSYRAGSAPVDPDFGVPHGIAGLWLPEFESRGYDPGAPYPENSYAFSNMVAKPYLPAHVVSRPDSSAGGNFDFALEKDSSAYSYAGVSMLEFFLRLVPPAPNPASEFLYVGRLGRGSPWYRHVEPFKFELHNIVRQRGGATILNNVIRPAAGEKVYVDYVLSRNGPVAIQVFTLDGNMVRTLVRENQAAGEYRAAWDGKNNGGREVSRGLYFIRVVAPGIDEIRKVMVVK